MQQPWEQGNAARDVSYDANPYQPVDYRQRLGAAPKRTGAYTPSQLYSGVPLPEDAPAAASAPQPSEWVPPGQLAPGTPYGAPTYPPAAPYGADGYLPEAPYTYAPSYGMGVGQPCTYPEEAPWSGGELAWGDVPFFDEAPQPVSTSEATYPPEPVYQQPEPEWKDPFAPTRSHVEDAPKAARRSAASDPKAHARPKLRPARVAAVCAAALMLVFCLGVGGRTIWEIALNEREMAELRDSYRERTGQELGSGAERVDLLPAGQTYVPTATPTPTMYAATPVPSPIIPINEAAIASLNGRETADPSAQPQEAAVRGARVRLSSYPKNPLHNVQESLTGLLAQNGDVVGRLVIADVLDEVVLQRNNTYYLNHTLLGTTNDAGSVFADESCSLRMPPENLLLRGQSSVPGKVFSPLWQFISGGASFAAAHTTAQLTTLYEDERYFLIAVLVAGSDPRADNYFNYASQPTFTTDEAMLAYVNSLRQHSLYDFAVDVQATDRLLTLATLGNDNSLVLVYRMAREGE